MNDTIAAISSSGGPIGLIRVSGERAIEAINAVFQAKNGKPLTEAPSQKLVYGTLTDKSGNVIDCCYAVALHAPHTYTGETMAELQCHGSTAVLCAGLDALFAQGVRQAEAGEFTRRAFLNGKMGLSEAEAVHDLITARTAEAAQNAAAQVMGAVGSPVQQMRDELLGMVAHFHAVVDFPDEDIDPVLFEDAAALIVRNAERYYFEGDDSLLPRSIATKAAFENAMSLDIAMGGSTNTVLHLLAVAHEAGVDFTMHDIARLSRKVPVLCKVAPNSHYHIQDVNRAGGILSILGELDRAKLVDTSVRRIDGRTLGEAIAACDLRSATVGDDALGRWRSAPAGKGDRQLGVQDTRYETLDTDRAAGCIRDTEHAYFRDGGLAVLTGNIARCGCVVKTAGVDEKLLLFRGPARVYESQEQAMEGILGDEVRPGEVVVIRYEGPKGGPGMQEMLYPTSYLKSKRLDKVCALVTDGRFSGGTSGLSIGHVSPEAAAGGEIAIVRTGDPIEIDIPNRSIRLLVDEREIAARKAAVKRYAPAARERRVPTSLRAYALLVSSADKGAVRLIDTPDNA